MSEEETETREVTKEELDQIPVYFHNPYFSLTNNLFCAEWGKKGNVTSPDGDWPWKFENTQELVKEEDLQEAFPHLEDINDVNSLPPTKALSMHWVSSVLQMPTVQQYIGSSGMSGSNLSML